jgi:hypothetical protein
VVAHAEDPNIVGFWLFSNICFNNDGAIADFSECDNSAVDEGKVALNLNQWQGVSDSGILGCGTDTVNPVSSADCPFTVSFFNECVPNQYALVKTTKSGHFWALKANGDCTWIGDSEATGLFPCLKTDAFDTVSGCMPDKVQISVEDGYIKAGTDTEPPISHCINTEHYGRMVVDSSGFGGLHICTQNGWEHISTDM